MKRTLCFSLLAMAGLTTLTSCETTGDPTQGGLFGWSQNKADYRISERRSTLDSLERDTARQQRRTDRLDSEYSRVKRSQD